jgi:uncharacterized membrane protein YtjA (UPF0391 family)
MKWTVIFLLLAVLSATLGFGVGLLAAQYLFVAFFTFFVLSLIAGVARKEQNLSDYDKDDEDYYANKYADYEDFD